MSPAVKVFGETVIVQLVALFAVIEQVPTDVVAFLKSVNTYVLPGEFALIVMTTLESDPETFTVFWLPPVAVATPAALVVSGAYWVVEVMVEVVPPTKSALPTE